MDLDKDAIVKTVNDYLDNETELVRVMHQLTQLNTQLGSIRSQEKSCKAALRRLLTSQEEKGADVIVVAHMNDGEDRHIHIKIDGAYRDDSGVFVQALPLIGRVALRAAEEGGEKK